MKKFVVLVDDGCAHLFEAVVKNFSRLNQNQAAIVRVEDVAAVPRKGEE